MNIKLLIVGRIIRKCYVATFICDFNSFGKSIFEHCSLKEGGLVGVVKRVSRNT